MSKVGVWIETGEDGVKEANFGVITAARSGGNAEIYAFILDGTADECQEALQTYGVQKVVALGAGPPETPPFSANAITGLSETCLRWCQYLPKF
jgi:hypothetical protein